MKKILMASALLVASLSAKSQVSLTTNNSATEINTAIVGTYNYRFYKTDNLDHNKNGFNLNDARITLDNRSPTYDFKLEFDLTSIANTVPDPTAPPINEAYFIYKGLGFIKIKTGYQKVVFSRDNLQEHFDMPFMQRPEFNRGTLFSRRDVGVTLFRTFWNEKVNAYAGIYSGQGESVLTNINDVSGAAEYAARVDVSYPCKYKYIQVDEVHTPFPIIQVGVNDRYLKKPSVSESAIFSSLNRERNIYGFDVAAAYRGVTFQMEMNQASIVPNSAGILQGKPTQHYKMGGASAQLNVHSKMLRSVFAVRYNELNPSDISPNDTYKALSFAYNFLINGYREVIKVQYTTPYAGFLSMVKDPETTLAAPFDPQLRIGWQYWFK